jgi:hypothetical protein
MPHADPDRRAEYAAFWRAAHPGYWRQRRAAGLDIRDRCRTVSVYVVLREDLAQERELARLEHHDPEEAVRLYRSREWSWLRHVVAQRRDEVDEPIATR